METPDAIFVLGTIKIRRGRRLSIRFIFIPAVAERTF